MQCDNAAILATIPLVLPLAGIPSEGVPTLLIRSLCRITLPMCGAGCLSDAQEQIGMRLRLPPLMLPLPFIERSLQFAPITLADRIASDNRKIVVPVCVIQINDIDEGDAQPLDDPDRAVFADAVRAERERFSGFIIAEGGEFSEQWSGGHAAPSLQDQPGIFSSILIFHFESFPAA